MKKLLGFSVAVIAAAGLALAPVSALAAKKVWCSMGKDQAPMQVASKKACTKKGGTVVAAPAKDGATTTTTTTTDGGASSTSGTTTTQPAQ